MHRQLLDTLLLFSIFRLECRSWQMDTLYSSARTSTKRYSARPDQMQLCTARFLAL